MWVLGRSISFNSKKEIQRPFSDTSTAGRTIVTRGQPNGPPTLDDQCPRAERLVDCRHRFDAERPSAEPIIGNRSLSNNPAAAGTANDRPNLDPSFNRATVITHNPSNWFNETMFDLPLAGTLGNEPRNFLCGPDLKNVDFAINKDSKAEFLGEQGIVQFRTECFNILNRPNFANPNATIASFTSPAAIQCGPQYAVKSYQFGSSSGPAINSTAGQITSTITTSRQIQFSLKLIF